MQNISYTVFNYIDDFMSIDCQEQAWASYRAMGNLLRDLGVHEAEDKTVQPTQVVELLGILYDFLHMVISLPEDKLKEL